jgi:hypothetical protein
LKKNLITDASFEINIDPSLLDEIKENKKTPFHLAEFSLFKEKATRLLSSSLPAAVLDKVVELEQFLFRRK